MPTLAHPPADTDDPALLIGLALAYVRQGSSASTMPAPLLTRLALHATSGDPTCSLVLDWLNARASGPDRSDATRRKSPRQRVLAKLAGPASGAGQPRGRKRPRWPVQEQKTPDASPRDASSPVEAGRG